MKELKCLRKKIGDLLIFADKGVGGGYQPKIYLHITLILPNVKNLATKIIAVKQLEEGWNLGWVTLCPPGHLPSVFSFCLYFQDNSLDRNVYM